MAFSFALLGILITVDVLAISNFFIIRALRRWIDVGTYEDENMHQSGDDTAALADYKANCFESFLFGYVLGKVKPDPLSAQQFPKWKPIPLFIGVTMTVFLVLIALALLSPEFLFNTFGVTFTGGSLSGDLCVDEDRMDTLSQLDREVRLTTNFDQASQQHQIMTEMYPALQSDVTLYGTETRYQCDPTSDVNSAATDVVALDGTKAQWVKDPFDYPAAQYGTYFPGYCLAKRRANIEIGELAVCGPREICICPRFPNSQPWRLIGWAGREICLVQVCFEFDNVPCGTLSNDDLSSLINDQNYRSQQMNHAAEEQEREMLEAEYPSISDELESTAAETFREILDQIDVASNIYSIYAVLSLYFPAPLDAFRLPYSVGIKQFTFGAQKSLFMFAVIVALYAYENLRQVLYSPDVQLFFANLRAGDPCFLDAGYIAQRQDILNDICEALLPLEPEFTFAATTSSAIVNNIESFEQECDCHYPMQMLFQFRSEEFPRTVMEPLGFTREVENICELAIAGQCETVYLPSTTINFLGNSSLCEDGMRARELVLQAPDSQMAGYELWIESGLIATFVLKFSMTNFMLSLLKLADPFVICAGRFMWIPLKFGLSLSAKDKAGLFAEFKEIKQASLWYITVRGAVFWGGLMHWALYNLMTTAFTNSVGSGGVDNSDVTILRATLLFSGLIALAAGLVVWLLNGSRKRERDAVYSGRKSGKDSDNLDDEDESESIEVDDDDSDESFYESDG